MLSGCSFLQSKALFVGCQVADGLTTWYAIKHGAAEGNQLLTSNVNTLMALKGGVITIGVWNWDAIEAENAGGLVNAISCLPVPSNLRVIRSQ